MGNILYILNPHHRALRQGLNVYNAYGPTAVAQSMLELGALT